MPLGLNNSGTFNALGKTGGEESNTLTTAQMPAHSHPLNNRIYADMATKSGNTQNFISPGQSGTRWISTSLNDGTGVPNTDSVGGGGAHNNMPPYVVLNFIIKAL